MTDFMYKKPEVGVQVEVKGVMYVTTDREPETGDLVLTVKDGVWKYIKANHAPIPYWCNPHSCRPLDPV